MVTRATFNVNRLGAFFSIVYVVGARSGMVVHESCCLCRMSACMGLVRRLSLGSATCPMYLGSSPGCFVGPMVLSYRHFVRALF